VRMKRITIFGATGRTGKLLVRKALEAGFEVVAYVRTPSRLDVAHKHLKVVVGELAEGEKITGAIQGADAVIGVLSAVRGGSMDVMSMAVEHILPAMEQQGVRRLVWAVGAGVQAPEDQPTVIHKAIEFLLRLTAREVLEDAVSAVEQIANSGLNWTIARGPMLTEAPGSGHYRVGAVNGEMGRTLSRENFADFILKQVESRAWIGKMPAVSDV
jgi:putative NADH-flavin reductase